MRRLFLFFMNVLTLDKKNGSEINNLYHPAASYDPESFDKIDIVRCLNKKNNKFLPILLKESFSLLKKGGKLNIVYQPETDGMNFEDLEKTLWWLFKGKYTINSHEKKGDKFHLDLTKNISFLRKEDSIDCWSFGMITNGSRPDFIKKSIQSIRDLKIPHYEIIICGFYPQYGGKDIKYIEFKERDDKGWITRKKNIIAANAKYTNLCIIHDRIIFNKDWYKGIKKYGNSFEVLSCVQKLSNGTRAGDWFSTNTSRMNPGYSYKIEELDYRDWDEWVYLSGQLTIIKKYIWEEVPWNETFYWGGGEDIEYSQRLTSAGYLSRFNPFSSCLSLSWRFGRLPQRLFLQKENSLLYALSDVPLRRLIRLMLYYGANFPVGLKLVNFFSPIILNTKLSGFIRNH